MNSSPSPKQANILWFALTALAVAVIVGLVAALFWGIGRVLNLLSPVLWPLALAAIVACVLSPVVDYIERQKVSRVRAIILVFALALAFIGGIFASVIPQVVVETRELVSKVPEFTQKIQQGANQFVSHPPELLKHLWPAQFTEATATNAPAAPNTGNGTNTTTAVAANAKGKGTEATPAMTPENKPLAAVTGWLAENLSGMGAWVWDQVGKLISGFGLLAGLILVPVYAFYFLLEKEAIEDRWQDYLPFRHAAAKREVVFVLHAIGQYLVAFFRGQVLVAVCDSILLTIGFLLAGLNYAFLLGCAAVILTMIPFLGAITVCLAAMLLAFVQFGDWLHPLLMLVIFAVVQTLEGLFISPKIMGDRVGLHPLVIIIAVMTGTSLMGGILGGVLAIPLAAALRVILHRYVWKDAETKGG